MPLRDRLRARFGRGKTTGFGEPTSLGANVKGYYTGRKDIEYYKPHEIPKPKYRGTLDKAHKESLEAYSFFDAFQTAGRRASAALSGTFSPGGTQALSAAPSAVPSRRPSWNSRAQSHNSSLSSPYTDVDSQTSTKNTSTSASSHDEVDSLKGRDITTDALLNTTFPTVRLDRQATVTDERPAGLNDSPFTLDELERAMTKATITPPRRVSVFA